MRSDLSNNARAEWIPISIERSLFAPEVRASLKWLVDLLEKTEKESHRTRTVFDIPLNQRVERRAS